MKNFSFHRVTRITALISISLAGLHTAAAQPQGLAERLRALNNNLLQLHGRAQEAPASTLADLRSQAAVVSKDRAAVLETLIRQSPSDALALAFSQDTITRLAETFPQSAGQLEAQGKWQGPVEYLVFDDRNLQVVQSLIRIKTSRGTMVVHFAGHEPAGLKGGDVLEVSGVTVNNNIAAMGGTIVSESAGTLAACTPTGPQNVAIISVTFPGVSPTISTS